MDELLQLEPARELLNGFVVQLDVRPPPRSRCAESIEGRG
jgi:hypothetical protein